MDDTFEPLSDLPEPADLAEPEELPEAPPVVAAPPPLPRAGEPAAL